MTPQERSAAIYKAIEALIDVLEDLKVETSIIAVAIDEAVPNGYGTSRVKGNSRIVLDMAGTIVKSLPVSEFFALMTAMATGPQFAENRGEDPNTPTDPKTVN
jgi:hypothetical protein